jgi:NAD(P)-dependent dehydrogenase (short-subunit alcohol dehydrogenase family)
VVHTADLADFASIRKVMERIKADEEKLDLLVNNAAVMLYPRFQVHN